jgi:hypothetical protein
MARVISEKMWHSNKLANVRPEWRSEYAWLVPIAFVDGTFEADPRNVWARAYAYSRPDWDAEKVAQLLDEFERVGLLQRITDKDGRVWGFWTGSDNFTPPPSKNKHYKAGKRALFTQGIEQVNTLCTQGENTVQTVCSPAVDGVQGMCSKSLGLSLCLIGDQEQPQEQRQEQKLGGETSFYEENTETAAATPKATQPGRKRDVLDRRDFETARDVAEFKAELAACNKPSVVEE